MDFSKGTHTIDVLDSLSLLPYQSVVIALYLHKLLIFPLFLSRGVVKIYVYKICLDFVFIEI